MIRIRLFSHIMASAVLLCLLATAGRTHELPHSFQGYPPAPPTLDPGPNAALLRLRIVDASTRQLVSATVSVNNGNQAVGSDPPENPVSYQ